MNEFQALNVHWWSEIYEVSVALNICQINNKMLHLTDRLASVPLLSFSMLVMHFKSLFDLYLYVYSFNCDPPPLLSICFTLINPSHFLLLVLLIYQHVHFSNFSLCSHPLVKGYHLHSCRQFGSVVWLLLTTPAADRSRQFAFPMVLESITNIHL